MHTAVVQQRGQGMVTRTDPDRNGTTSVLIPRAGLARPFCMKNHKGELIKGIDYMAIDQHGTTYHGLGPYPRKTLLDRLDRKRAVKLFVDDESGESFHIGYLIAGLWLTIYEVQPMRRKL